MLRLYGRSQGALEAAPFFVGCEQGPLREDDERRGLGRRRERARDRAIGLLARRARRRSDGVAALLQQARRERREGPGQRRQREDRPAVLVREPRPGLVDLRRLAPPLVLVAVDGVRPGDAAVCRRRRRGLGFRPGLGEVDGLDALRWRWLLSV